MTAKNGRQADLGVIQPPYQAKVDQEVRLLEVAERRVLSSAAQAFPDQTDPLRIFAEAVVRAALASVQATGRLNVAALEHMEDLLKRHDAQLAQPGFTGLRDEVPFVELEDDSSGRRYMRLAIQADHWRRVAGSAAALLFLVFLCGVTSRCSG